MECKSQFHSYTVEHSRHTLHNGVRVRMAVVETNGSRKRKKSSGAGSRVEPVIPDKLYFRIGEVARLLGIATYVLRFWEGEFPQLHPNKGGTGQRLYRRRDVETALRIKHLLYDEGYTIPGARQFLKSEPRQNTPELPFHHDQTTPEQRLRKLHSELTEIAGLLARPLPGDRRITGRTEHRGLHIAQRRPASATAATELFQDKKPLPEGECRAGHCDSAPQPIA